jgi:hypothetical protein
MLSDLLYRYRIGKDELGRAWSHRSIFISISLLISTERADEIKLKHEESAIHRIQIDFASISGFKYCNWNTFSFSCSIQSGDSHPIHSVWVIQLDGSPLMSESFAFAHHHISRVLSTAVFVFYSHCSWSFFSMRWDDRWGLKPCERLYRSNMIVRWKVMVSPSYRRGHLICFSILIESE